MAEKLSQKDYELINSYLDQELDRKDVVKFAARMAEDPAIGEEVEDLMKVKAMIRELPTVTPPRNYILTRAMAEEARPKPWWERLFPVFRTAAAFCALALAFTFLFPLLRSRQNSAPAAGEKSVNSYAVEEAAEADFDYAYEEAAPVAKSFSLYDEEIVLEERDYDSNVSESYRAVMPSYGVMGGNPRIEYMMRQEENQKAMNSAQSAAGDVIPEGYISIEEANAAQRSLALKMLFSGGLVLCLCVLFVLRKRRKKLELS